MTIKDTLRRYFTDAGRAVDKAPVEVALAFTTALFISYSIEHKNAGDVTFRFANAAFFSAAVAWSATLLYAMHAITLRQRWAATLLGGGLGAFYLLLMPDLAHDAEVWRTLMLISAAALLMLAVPGWAPITGDANLRLRRVDARVLLRVVGISLYGLALFAGLALALMAINNLFELKLENELYLHVLVWIMVVLVPWVIVGGLDDYVRPIEEQSDVARVVHRLATFLVIPLVALYYLILFAYAIRIVITRELPQNLVSPMVIAAGLLATLGLMLFDPEVDSRAGLRWLRFTPVLFIVLAPLGVWALYARIGAYGWTEFRLLRLIVLLALLLMALLAVMQLVRRQRYSLRMVPALLAVVLLLSAVGPWNVLAVARRDQQHRLLAALRQAHVNVALVPAPGDTTRIIAGPLYYSINSSAAYLVRQFGEDALPPGIPARLRQRPYSMSLAGYYHLQPADTDSARRFYSGSLERGSPVELPSRTMAYRVQFSGGADHERGAHMSHDTLVTALSGDTVYIPLADALSIARTRAEPDQTLPARAASAAVLDAHGTVRGEAVILDITFVTQKQRTEVNRVQLLVLLRK